MIRGGKLHLRAHHDRERRRHAAATISEHRIGAGAALRRCGAVGGIGEHHEPSFTQRLVNGMLHHYICSARGDLSVSRIDVLALGGGFEPADRALLAHPREQAAAISGPLSRPGQREAKRMEQLAALLAGRLPSLRRSARATARRTSRASRRSRGLLDQQALVMAELGRIDLAMQAPRTSWRNRTGARGCRGAAASPASVAPSGSRSATAAKSSVWSSRALTSSTSCGSKWAGARPKVREVEVLARSSSEAMRLDRLRRADPRQHDSSAIGSTPSSRRCSAP